MKKCMFMGSKKFGLELFKAVEPIAAAEWRILHPDDSSDVRSALSDFSAYAKERSIDLLHVSSAAAAAEAIRDFRPDIVLVCGWYWMLAEDVLALSEFYGIHNSLLPAYRGNAPLVWSIIKGEERVGSSVFKIGPGMDDGDILLQVSVDNEPSDTIATLLAKLEASLATELPGAWRALLNGTGTIRPQDSKPPSYGGLRMEEDGRIDWTRDAFEVHNFIRAQTRPYPGAYSHFGENKITFWDTAICRDEWFSTPGQLLSREGPSALIACGRGAVWVTTVSVGGQDAQASQVLKSLRSRLR